MSKHARDASTDTETPIEKKAITLPPFEDDCDDNGGGCLCLTCELCKGVEECIDRALEVIRSIEVPGEETAWSMDPTPSTQTEAQLLRVARARAAHSEFSVRSKCFEIFPLGRYGAGVDLIVRSLKGTYWQLKMQCGDEDDTECDDTECDRALTSAEIFRRSVSLLESHLHRCAAAIKEARQASYDNAIIVRGNIALIVLGACQGVYRNKNALDGLLGASSRLRRYLDNLKNVLPRLPICTMVRPEPAPVALDVDDKPAPTSLPSQDPAASSEQDSHDQLP